jgi:hypothetical protein
MLHQKHWCSKRFLESDFMTAEKIHLNRVAVTCVSDSTSHSISSLLAPYLDSLSFFLTPEDDLHLLPLTRTYSKMSLTFLTVTPTPVHEDSPSTSPQIPALQVSPPLTSTFAAEEISFAPISGNVSALVGNSGSSVVKVLPQSLE